MLAALSTTLLAPAAPAAAGEAMLGVTQGPSPEMVRFDTAAPQSLTARVPVVGLLAGETVEGIDQRPSSGQIAALTSINRVLLLDPATGVLTQPGLPIDGTLFALGQVSGIDFNPTVNRLRLVNVSNDNLRFNPLTFTPVDGDDGTVDLQPDTELAYMPGDPSSAADPAIVASAYDRNDNDPTTATTLYGIDSAQDALVRQGAPDGNPVNDMGGGSPNLGLLTTLGLLGVNGDGTTSMDIAGPPATAGVAWAAMRPVGATASTLFSVNLSPGPVASRATALGAIGGAPIAGLTVLRGGAIRGAAPSPAGEGAGQAVVRVERIGEALAPASLSFRTADRTAVAGRDYAPVSGTLDFGQGERAKDVAIPLLQDAVAEPAEGLAVELGAPSGGAVLEAPVVAVEIADDDAATGPPDRTRPGYLQTATKPRSLAALRRRPLMRVRVACTEACRVVLTLRLKSIRLGTGRATLRAAGSAQVTIRLSTAGRRALIGPSRLSGAAILGLRARVTDLAGNVTTRRLSLRVPRRERGADPRAGRAARDGAGGRRGRDRPCRGGARPRGPFPLRDHRDARRARVDGHDDPRGARRGGPRHALVRRRDRGARARQLQRGRHGRGPHRAGDDADRAVRRRRAEAALGARPGGRQATRRDRADRARGRVGRGRLPHARGRAARWRLDARRREDVHHQRGDGHHRLLHGDRARRRR